MVAGGCPELTDAYFLYLYGNTRSTVSGADKRIRHAVCGVPFGAYKMVERIHIRFRRDTAFKQRWSLVGNVSPFPACFLIALLIDQALKGTSLCSIGTPVSMVFGALFTIFSKTEKIYSKRQKTPENPPDFCQFIIAKTLDLR